MKKLFLALLLLAMPFTPTGWTGMTCSQNQQSTTFKSLATLGQGVNTAYAAWNDQVVAGKATFNPAVAAAYNKFQAGYAVAVGAGTLTTGPAPSNLTDIANEVYAAIQQFTK